MKILVIGGVAAGTKAAAKLRREDSAAEVTVLAKDKDISYAGCGLPYYVGGVIEKKSALIVNTPSKFRALTGAAVITGKEAVALDRAAKKITAVDVVSGEENIYEYDKLMIAVGASPVVPKLPGVALRNVFVMRKPDDAASLRALLDSGTVGRAVVCGAGFVGLEVAENLAAKGVKVSVIDMAEQILPGFDTEVAGYVGRRLAERGIICFTGTRLEGIEGDGHAEKVLTSRGAVKADAAVLALGVRPNTAFLAGSGIETAPDGTIIVDGAMRTNDPSVYAAGDCVTVVNRITGARVRSPMGSSANMEGRVAATNMAGGDAAYPGVLGTGVCKLPRLNVGRTGLAEAEAKAAGFDAVSVTVVVDDKAHYYPGAGSFIVKMTADAKSGRLLGMQTIGEGAVDKMTDIAAAAISLKATLPALENLDLAYAPPFSTAIHPFVQTVNILLNKLSGSLDSFTPAEFAEGAAAGYRLVDTSLHPALAGLPHIDYTKIGEKLDGFAKDEKLLLICARGKRAYLTQNKLKAMGYTNTKVLEGGHTFTEIKTE